VSVVSVVAVRWAVCGTPPSLSTRHSILAIKRGKCAATELLETRSDGIDAPEGSGSGFVIRGTGIGIVQTDQDGIGDKKGSDV
jgi:hypothetical protein